MCIFVCDEEMTGVKILCELLEVEKKKRNRRYVVNHEELGYKKQNSGEREEITLEKSGATHVFLSDTSGRNRQKV